MSRFAEIAAKANEGKASKAKGKQPPHVRIRRGYYRAGLIAKLGGPVKWAVYCILLDCQNGNTGEAYPAVERMAAGIGVSGRSVQYALRHLEELGIIKATSTKKGGHAKSVSYFIQPWQTVHILRPLDETAEPVTVQKTTANGAPYAPERIKERERRIGLTPTAASTDGGNRPW